MTNMFRDANKVAQAFLGGGGKLGFMELVTDLLAEVKAEHGTDVMGDASEGSQWHSLDGVIMHVVKQETDAEKGKQPGEGRSANTVHVSVGGILDCLPAALSRVLLLLVGLALPRLDEKGAKNFPAPCH